MSIPAISTRKKCPPANACEHHEPGSSAQQVSLVRCPSRSNSQPARRPKQLYRLHAHTYPPPTPVVPGGAGEPPNQLVTQHRKGRIVKPTRGRGQTCLESSETLECVRSDLIWKRQDKKKRFDTPFSCRHRKALTTGTTQKSSSAGHEVENQSKTARKQPARTGGSTRKQNNTSVFLPV